MGGRPASPSCAGCAQGLPPGGCHCVRVAACTAACNATTHAALLPPLHSPPPLLRAVWLDAKDSHLVIHEEGDEDAASVASDASTVVPDHHSGGQPGPEEAAAAEQEQLQQAREEQWGQQAECAAAPAELPEAAPAAQPAMAVGEEQLGVAPFSAEPLQPEPFEPEPAGLDAPFPAVPIRRSSLSPAASAGHRRSSLGVAPAQPQQAEAESAPLRVSLAGGIAELAAADEAVATIAQAEQPAAAPLASPAAAPPSGEAPVPSPEPSAVAAAPAAEASSAGQPLQPEASRLSLSSSLSAAPSLRIEYSEASLRYSGAPLGRRASML